MPRESAIKEKTKKIKVRCLNEDGDLAMTLIEVPASDERPAWDGKPLRDVDGMQVGTGPQ